MSLRVLIAVTHLLGAGHLTRAAALARALARAGHAVTLCSGGMPVPLIGAGAARLVQLPPVRIEGTDFGRLLGADDAPVTDRALAERRSLLLGAHETVRPDVVVTELYPFGRRILAAEFDRLLEAARRASPRPLVLASVRDIVAAPSKPSRVEAAHLVLRERYDGVLVHADPHLVPLDASWPLDDEVRGLLHYTGYVDEGSPPPRRDGEGREVVVSGGSSAAGLALYRTTLAAAQAVADRPWRILVGRGLPEDEFQALARSAPAHATVERARPDFRTLLAGAAASVSQAGYNTVVDLLKVGTPAVLVPFEAGRETEQRLRAERLRDLGLAEVVPEAELAPERLAAAVRSVLGRAGPAPAFDLNGAEQSCRIIEDLVEEHRGRVTAPAHLPPRARIDWSPLRWALRETADRGGRVVFWWRDDDAVAPTPAVDRLLALTERFRAPLALAAIPALARPDLADRVAEAPLARAIVHGFAHANHAPAGEKKAELGAHRPLADLARDAAAGLERARALFGDRLTPVLAPPWNRIAPDLLPLLPDLGFQGLSVFGGRHGATAAPPRVDSTLDPIDWHGGRGLADPERLVAEAASRVASSGAESGLLGLLTHHLDHTEEVWRFVEEVLSVLAEGTCVDYPFVDELFLTLSTSNRDAGSGIVPTGAIGP